MEIINEALQSYLDNLEDNRLKDIRTLIDIAKDITKKEPVMWGSMIGFGKIHYKYESKHEGETFEFGFASRKQVITLYLGCDVSKFKTLNQLGKYKQGKGCLYIKKLLDIDIDVLKLIIKEAVSSLRNNPTITNIS